MPLSYSKNTICSFSRTAISAACSSSFGTVKFFSLIGINLNFPKTNETFTLLFNFECEYTTTPYASLDESAKNAFLLFQCVCVSIP